MIVVDSTVWIEFLRETGSDAHRTLHRLLSEGADLAVTELVVLEVLSGAASERQAQKLRSTLLAFPVLALAGIEDFERAAALYRACRAAGETVRSHVDCLIAVPTVAANASLLHADRDFDIIARHSTLRIEPLGEIPADL